MNNPWKIVQLEQIIFLTKKWKPAEKIRVIAIAQNRHDEVFFSKKILNNNYIDTRHLQLSSVKKSILGKKYLHNISVLL